MENGISEPARGKHIPADATHEDPLLPVFRAGELVSDVPPLAESRNRTKAQVGMISESIKRVMNPHAYPAGIETRPEEEKARLIAAARVRNAS